MAFFRHIHRNFLFVTILRIFLLFITLMFHAGVAAQGSGVNLVEALYSNGYDGRSKESMSVFTFRHARPLSLGDNFFFIDVSNPDNYKRGGSLYIEWGPRLSIGKTFTDAPISFGLIGDVYLMGELNYAHNPRLAKTTSLYGFSLDLLIPGFTVFKVNVEKRNDPDLAGSSEQMSLIWNYPFRLFDRSFSFEGFLDMNSPEGGNPGAFHTQPQLLWKSSRNLGIGVEYQYWRNKNGRRGFTESVIQAMFRWTF